MAFYVWVVSSFLLNMLSLDLITALPKRSPQDLCINEPLLKFGHAIPVTVAPNSYECSIVCAAAQSPSRKSPSNDDVDQRTVGYQSIYGTSCSPDATPGYGRVGIEWNELQNMNRKCVCVITVGFHKIYQKSRWNWLPCGLQDLGGRLEQGLNDLTWQIFQQLGDDSARVWHYLPTENQGTFNTTC
ncbi:hypothetical protein BCR37DRAFT_113940 [Protomyces lactucae-debilis]|uniref:Uncharacterized protein n=1 Tax=Protomyces lactucae-debilis TaxID=2754530 RepID=A0A1Y2F499_PROLT|nr:uncharacterized protein BCR37DRAFT_113940 [Protomyces lactucae-debilis]ORY78146.1 hypothetical protein BCR37DRAFT_113940 [Protomyces lactucae-debilis]